MSKMLARVCRDHIGPRLCVRQPEPTLQIRKVCVGSRPRTLSAEGMLGLLRGESMCFSFPACAIARSSLRAVLPAIALLTLGACGPTSHTSPPPPINLSYQTPPPLLV